MSIESNDSLGYIHRFEQGNSETTLLLLHGTGGNENDLIPLGKMISPNANLLSPRGNVLEDGMYNRFFRRLAEGVFDNEDVILRAGQLKEFVIQASKTYQFDLAKVWAVGFSNGANMAAAIMVLHPELLSGAILLSPMRPIDPVNPPDLYGKQIFIGAGESDTIAPPDGVIQLADQLKGFGADVESHFYPIGHRISQDELSDAKNWIDHRISD